MANYKVIPESTAYRFLDIEAAYRRYNCLTPLQMAEVEARLLAGQGNDAIAERCDIAAAVVGVYHDLFYDVRPHLGDPAVIARLALHWWSELGDAKYIGPLKLFGYSLGGRAVDALLHYVVAPPDVGAGVDDVSAAESQQTLWERLLGQVTRTLTPRSLSERTDQLLSLVALLREEGSGLVAEGVDIPVPCSSRFAPVTCRGMRACHESWDDDIDEEDLEELLILDDEEED